MFWKPDDKEWLAQRKKDWAQVKYNLDAIASNDPKFKKRSNKQQKELFFKGEITLNPVPTATDPDLEAHKIKVFSATDLEKPGLERCVYNEGFGALIGLFYIWFHPEPETIDLNQLRINNFTHQDITLIRGDFFSRTLNFPVNLGNKRAYNSYYGMMGGKEKYCIDLLYPSLDYKEKLELFSHNKKKSIPLCSSPKAITQECLKHTVLELRYDARFTPHAPGQYLWDHFSYALENYYDECFSPKDNIKNHQLNQLKSIIAEVLLFKTRKDTSKKRMSTIHLVDNLLSKYEQRKFTKKMLKFWDSVKENLDQKGHDHNHLFFETPLDILSRHGSDDDSGLLSLESQADRISQWKLI